VAKKKFKPGSIDLPALFEAIWEELRVSVTQGRLLHRTKNIREAGLPFEQEFRRYLSSRLAAPFRVFNGYLFDPSSVCTPQIDAIVVDERGAHEMMRSPEGATYVPYPCGRAFFEIKNAVKGLSGHLAQVDAIGSALTTMRSRAERYGVSGQSRTKRPLSVLVVGDSASARLPTFKKLYTDGLHDPQLTVLLDRGLVIARRGNDLSDFIVFENEGPGVLRFSLTGENGPWAIWKPRSEEFRRGQVLLWLYFAMIARLNSAESSKGFVSEFTDQIERDFPLEFQTELKTATKWP
jgi:hypothetical protein